MSLLSGFRDQLAEMKIIGAVVTGRMPKVAGAVGFGRFANVVEKLTNDVLEAFDTGVSELELPVRPWADQTSSRFLLRGTRHTCWEAVHSSTRATRSASP